MHMAAMGHHDSSGNPVQQDGADTPQGLWMGVKFDHGGRVDIEGHNKRRDISGANGHHCDDWQVVDVISSATCLQIAALGAVYQLGLPLDRGKRQKKENREGKKPHRKRNIRRHRAATIRVV